MDLFNRRLFYREVPHMPGVLVFAESTEAERVSRIHHAISTAKTWGEFKALMPAEDFAEIVASLDELGDEEPSGSEPFEPDNVPGFSDGDYPAWLQAEMGRIIPKEILQRFASRQTTTLNGNYWEIPAASENDIVVELRRSGFVVERRDDLDFH